MRIVFCGSGDVAVPSLRALAVGGYSIPAVVTQPPRPAGRGGKLAPTPVDLAARELGLPVLQIENINAPEAVAALKELRPDLLVVVDFGQKVGLGVRELAPLGAFNMHASLLPELRGAAPINRAILAGLATTGVTTFFLVDKMDAGAILLQRPVEILPDETAEELRARLAEQGASLVVETVEALKNKAVQPVEQDHAKATAAAKLSKEDGRLDFSQPADQLARQICGTWPWPGAVADFHHADRPSVRVIFARARAAEAYDSSAGEPGTVRPDLSVACGRGRLEILELKVAGKRLMGWKDFVNGYRVAPGDRFSAVQEGAKA